MGGRYNVRASGSSRPHGSPLQTTKPSSSVQPGAGGGSTRADARGRLPYPEGGSGSTRMKKRVFTLLLTAGVLAAAALTALTFPAFAQTQTVYVRLATGEVVPGTVDVPPGATLDDIQLPGPVVPAPTAPTPTTPTVPTVPSVPKPPPTTTSPAPSPGGNHDQPSSGGGQEQERTSSGRRVDDNSDTTRGVTGRIKSKAKDELSKARRHGRRTPLRNADGSPTPTNPGFTDVLPGPSTATGVPNFIIRRFRVPPFLLSIYQAAGIEYGVRWEVLAAINEIETDYGRNLNVSSAGALGWMQFMPSTWKMYGVDANKDGKRDPYNPVDAIFASARYLKAAGGDNDIRRAIFAYNHAGWYVDSVMLRARLIAGYPPDLIGSLTGLTEGRFPIAAKARYEDDQAAKSKQVGAGQNAANVIDSSTTRRSIDISAKPGSPVVAVNDGVIKEIGHSKSKGNYVVLQDVYGNRYTYSGLGSVAHLYPVPKEDAKKASKSNFQPVGANDPKPSAPASAGTQRPGTAAPAPASASAASTRGHSRPPRPHKPARARIAAVKERLFAHPQRPAAKRNGGMDQLLQSETPSSGSYDNYFAKPLGLNSKNATLKRLKKGSRVVGSTILGRVGKDDGSTRPQVTFEIQPAGTGAPKIAPKPFLAGW